MNLHPGLFSHLAVGVLISVLFSLLIFELLMQPPMAEMGFMAGLLAITAIVSIIVGFAAYRMGWMHQAPGIRWSLVGGYILASVLTFINVWLAARLMFNSQHDLLLATVLLIFAGGIAVVLGSFFANALTDRISSLKLAAQSLSAGDLGARAPAEGQDELAELASSFNDMADQLQSTNRKREELDLLRRDLIAWVSHDLQTPLASIRAMLEALADGIVEDPATRQRYLENAQREVRSLSMLIDDLFQVAQIDAGGIPLDLSQNSMVDLISDTLESFSELAARQGVHLEGQVEPGIDPVMMDTQRIGRVLNNLVSNALRHTPENGLVEISARRVSGGIQVEVRDNGEGIAPQDLPHVFDRFYRGERSRSRSTGGAGLGLAIAHGIIQAHGGWIKVECQPGVGTRFYFILPA
jgi:signal transduction histidine kinase